MTYIIGAPVSPATTGPGFKLATDIKISVPVTNAGGPEKLKLSIEVWEGRYLVGGVAMVASYTQELTVPPGTTGNFEFLHTVIAGPNWGAGQYRRDLRAALEYQDDSVWTLYGEYGWEDIYHVATEKYTLIQDYTYPAAGTYYGNAEECTFTFKLMPEQIPGTAWLGDKIIQSFADEIEKEGAQMLRLEVYEDTSPVLWTDYMVIATATASPIAWTPVIIVIMLILFIAAIVFAIIEIKKFLWGEEGENGGLLGGIGEIFPLIMLVMVLGMMGPMMGGGEGGAGG